MEKFAPGMAQRTSPLKNPNWDALLTSRPDFSFFHGAAWAKVLVETYRFTPQYFFSGRPEAPEALLPLMETDSWLRGRRGTALPFTDECPPLGADQESFGRLFAEAVAFGKARGWKSIECRGGRNLFAREVPASRSFYGHQLDLTVGEKVLFENMDGSVRRAVRKAEKEGLRVEFSQSLEAVKVFYGLQCQTRKRHGLPPQPFEFFSNIQRHVLSNNSGVVVLASHREKALAGAVYFFLGGRAIYKFGASDFTQQQLRGSNLVMWEAMKWLAGQGVKSLHLGKTSQHNEGLRRFKLHLGAQEEVIDYVKFDLRQDRFVTDTDAISGWHNGVFRILPGFMSRAAGRLLYKHWA
jgi:Acetyltransferase (GNAT) domain